MLEYAYHLVSFSAGGVAIGAIVGGLWWLDSNVQDEALAEIEAQRDRAETQLSSEKFETEALCETNAMLRDRCGRLARENATLKAFKTKRNLSRKQRAALAPKPLAKPIASAEAGKMMGVGA